MSDGMCVRDCRFKTANGYCGLTLKGCIYPLSTEIVIQSNGTAGVLKKGENKMDTETITTWEAVAITKGEAVSLFDYLEIHLLDDIRSDYDIDSMEWLHNMMNVWKKCKEVAIGNDKL